MDQDWCETCYSVAGLYTSFFQRKNPLKHSIKTSTLYRRKLLGNIEDPDRGSDHEFADEDKKFKHMKTISSEVDNLKSPED